MNAKRLALVLCAVLLWASPAAASFTLLTHTVAVSTDTNTLTSGAIDTTGADLIVIVESWYPGINTPLLITADTGSNSWSYGTSACSGSTFHCSRIAYVVNPTTNAAHTFTANLSSTYAAIAVLAFSGSKLTSPFDQENGGSTTGATTLQTGSVTPSEDNELIIAGVGNALNTGVTFSINSGFTISDQGAKTANGDGVAAAYLIQTTAGAVNPTWTFSSSEDGGATIATFKSAAGGAVTPKRMLLLGVGQ